jgi:hypothetical protein
MCLQGETSLWLQKAQPDCQETMLPLGDSYAGFQGQLSLWKEDLGCGRKGTTFQALNAMLELRLDSI